MARGSGGAARDHLERDRPLRIVDLTLLDQIDEEADSLAADPIRPNREARRLLPVELRDDPALFPDRATLARCHALHDLGAEEQRVASALPTRCAKRAAGHPRGYREE
jgi:hypothetical protein